MCMRYKFRDKFGLLEGTPLSLEGKSAIVTGGGAGMGQATSILFAKQGCAIGVCDLDEKGVAETIQIIKEKYPNAKAFPLIGDVTDHNKAKVLTDYFASQAGSVDVLVTCAGIVERKAFEDITPEKWDRMIRIHLNGTYNWIHAAIPYMKKQNSGKIIAIGSNIGQIGCPENAHYCAAKAGISGLIKTIAQEFAKYKITANVVSPGTTHTGIVQGRTEEDQIERGKMVLLGRQAEPLEISYLCLLLASKAGDYITGQQIGINGGEGIVGI
jgi:NAD(P)-dependent dehydrogenase (short-subunit alcohol dehydrogenase family)